MSKPTFETSIDLSKIDKNLLPKKKEGAKTGPYMNIAGFPRKDDYGNDGFVVQKVSKDQREAGIQGPIIGNWKYVDQPNRQTGAAPKQAPKPAPKPPIDPDLDADDDSSNPF